MCANGVNSWLESPLYHFIEKRWPKWEQMINKLEVEEKDFLLYLIWTLDSIKDPDFDASDFWSILHNELRKTGISRGYSAERDDNNYLTDLLYACGLYCVGSVLTSSIRNRDLYSKLVSGLDRHWAKVIELKNGIKDDDNTPALKLWLREYFDSDVYYTREGKIAWADDLDEGLPAVVGRSRTYTHVQLNVGQLYVEQMNNAGDVNDFSIHLNENNDENR